MSGDTDHGKQPCIMKHSWDSALVFIAVLGFSKQKFICRHEHILFCRAIFQTYVVSENVNFIESIIGSNYYSGLMREFICGNAKKHTREIDYCTPS